MSVLVEHAADSPWRSMEHMVRVILSGRGQSEAASRLNGVVLVIPSFDFVHSTRNHIEEGADRSPESKAS